MDSNELRPAGWDPVPAGDDALGDQSPLATDDDADGNDDADGADDAFDEPDRRIGQLVALPDDDDPSDEVGEWQDVLAEEELRTPGERCAEEAAMHIVREGHGGLTFDEDPYGTTWDERR